MYFEDISSFFDMGGYGLYVWLSFGSAALCLVVLWLDSLFSKRTLLTKVLSEQARQARIKAAAEKSAIAKQSAAAEQRTNGETI
jgi:heme exporter protein D